MNQTDVALENSSPLPTDAIAGPIDQISQHFFFIDKSTSFRFIKENLLLRQSNTFNGVNKV